MRITLALAAALLFAAPIGLSGCDRTASTETTHTEATPSGTEVTHKTQTTDMDTGKTTVTQEKKTTGNP